MRPSTCSYFAGSADTELLSASLPVLAVAAGSGCRSRRAGACAASEALVEASALADAAVGPGSLILEATGGEAVDRVEGRSLEGQLDSLLGGSQRWLSGTAR